MHPPLQASSISAGRRLTFTAGDERSFGAYHDLYAGGSTVSRHGSGFRASLAAYRFPRLLMFDRRVAGASHHRDEARVRRDGLDHFNIQALRAGRMMAGAPGEECVMRPGDVVVFDASRPQRTVVDRADYAVIGLPREVVEDALPGARRLHGTVLPKSAAGLLSDFVLSLVCHAPTLGDGLASQSGRMVAGLLAGTTGGGGAGGRDGSNDDMLALHRARAEAHIEAHLSDPTLDVEGIAAALGLSRSALYRAFAPVDGVARRITVRRLGALRAALRRPGEVRSVASLAFDLGFASESHCNRAFKAAFGLPPGQFRAEARSAHAARDGGAQASRFSDWISELH